MKNYDVLALGAFMFSAAVVAKYGLGNDLGGNAWSAISAFIVGCLFWLMARASET